MNEVVKIHDKYTLKINEKLYCLLIATLVCILLSSCVKLNMVDSSADQKYSFVIGKKFKLKEDVWANKIAYNYKPPAEYILLFPGVGIGGPEVLSRSKMNKGTILQVTKVLTAKYFGPKFIVYVVKEHGSSQINCEQIEIRIDVTGDIKDATFGLDGNVYEVVP